MFLFNFFLLGCISCYLFCVFVSPLNFAYFHYVKLSVVLFEYVSTNDCGTNFHFLITPSRTVCIVALLLSSLIFWTGKLHGTFFAILCFALESLFALIKEQWFADQTVSWRHSKEDVKQCLFRCHLETLDYFSCTLCFDHIHFSAMPSILHHFLYIHYFQ